MAKGMEKTDADIELTEARTAVETVNKELKELEVPGLHLDSVLNTDRMQAYIRMRPENRYQMLAQEIKSKVDREHYDLVGKKLSNAYQREVNRLAENNMSVNSSELAKVLEYALRFFGIEIPDNR